MNYCKVCRHSYLTPECPLCGRINGFSNRTKKKIATRFAASNELDYRAVYDYVRNCDADNEELLIHLLEKAVERDPVQFERLY